MITGSQKHSAATRLATYGTLGPGRPNHHQLADLDGNWHWGTIRGRLVEAGWGAQAGFPGLVLDPTGDVVELDIFTSSDLPDHWARLDAFEGAEYQRVIINVTRDRGSSLLDLCDWR
ncbi:MAG: gamma-glutamylcyclotransferase family protein [Parvularculaceae bacterium]